MARLKHSNAKCSVTPNGSAVDALTFKMMRASIPQRCYERSFGIGICILSIAFIVYGTTTYLLYTAKSLSALTVFVVLRGFAVAPTFIVGHDACHDALTPSARWNCVLARIALLPSWHTYTAWRYRHNFVHHRYTQILGLDSGYPPADATQFRRMKILQRLQYRLSRTIPFAGLLYFPEWFWSHIMPNVEKRKEYKLAGRYFALDYAIIILYMACEVALFSGLFSRFGLVAKSHFHPAVMLFCGIIITQFLWNWEMGVVTFLHHFHPNVPWYRDSDAPPAAERHLVSTIHVRFPIGLNWGFFNILEHTAHHVCPQIPCYQLGRAQNALQGAYAGLMTQENFSPTMLRKTFRECKLYDPVAKVWIGYPR